MTTTQAAWRMDGFSYVEVLVATVLVAVSLVPAVNALRTGIQGAPVLAAGAAPNQGLFAKMEEVLGRPYAVLDFAANRAASSATVPVQSPRSGSNPGLDPGPGYSDATFDVYIWRVDGTTPTTADTGLLRVRVAEHATPANVADAMVTR